MDVVKYEVIEKLGVLSTSNTGWTKELRLISWNGGAPKYDIREWAPNDAKMGKGVTFTKEAYEKLKEIITK